MIGQYVRADRRVLVRIPVDSFEEALVRLAPLDVVNTYDSIGGITPRERIEVILRPDNIQEVMEVFGYIPLVDGREVSEDRIQSALIENAYTVARELNLLIVNPRNVDAFSMTGCSGNRVYACGDLVKT